MAKRTTLKDIARETGLSESAVSQVLNNRPCRLAEESKQLIRETARRLDYRPNRAARSLALHRSEMLGAILPDIANPFFASLAKHLESCCRERGLGLAIASSGDDFERDCEQLRRLDSLGVDGVVFVPSVEIPDEGETEALARVLAGLSCPIVMVDRIVEGVTCDKVVVDNSYGARLATEYLLGRGHRRIGCLANTERSCNGRLRLAGYRRALEDAGFEFAPELVGECDYHGESGYEAVGALVERGITALFSTSDLITVGAIRRAAEMGLSVPDELSVVSFDHNEASELFMPSVTSVDQNVSALAENAVELLCARVEGKAGEAQLRVIEPTLVEGTSVARPRW